MHPISPVELLSSIVIFHSIPGSVKELIASAMVQETVEDGQEFIRKGELGSCLYILAKGHIRVHDGEHSLAVLPAGSVVGELSLLDTEPRSASVSAVGSCQLYRLDQEPFFQIVADQPAVLQAMITVVIQRLRGQNQSVIESLRKREQELTVLVAERTAEVVQQKEIIEQQNKDMLDSINYAKRIQLAILPSQTELQQHMSDGFVLYIPKDIVSGDFYWYSKIGGQMLLAAADCTGHGVPGAFMSLLGATALNYVVNTLHFSRPADVLENVHQEIVRALSRNDDGDAVNDGMDIALINLDFAAGKVQFAGAHRPLVRIRDGELEMFKGSNRPIGAGSQKFAYKPFANHDLDWQPNDIFYLFSDGYCDQFGGADGKKFRFAGLQELLMSIYQLPFSEQHTILANTLKQWLGQEYEQIDDILVLGIKT